MSSAYLRLLIFLLAILMPAFASSSPAFLMMYSAAAAKLLQWYPTLRNPRDGSPQGFPVPGTLQARTLEWLPFPSPMRESEVAQSCPTLATPWTAAHLAPPSTGFSRQKYWSGVPLPSPMMYSAYKLNKQGDNIQP